MSDAPDQCNTVQSPIIMKIDAPDDSSSNENSSETENSTSSTSSNIPTMWVFGSTSSKSATNNPFILNNKKSATLRPSFLRPSQLGSNKNEESSEKSNGPLAPSKLNPFKRNIDDEVEQNVSDTKENETSSSNQELDKSNDKSNKKLHEVTESAKSTTSSTSSGPTDSKSTLVSSFVFGQNVHDRVVTEGTTEANEKEEPVSNNTNNATSSNGTSENLFTSLLKKEVNETQTKENHAVSLTESAKAYEESRANKRKYEEVEVITGEEGEKNVIQLCCKLFAFQAGIWQDRGRGTMRLNDLEDGDSRLVWRNVGSHRVMLNTLVWEDMTVERASPKSLRITAVDSAAQIKVFLIMAGPTEMDQLQEALTTRVSIAKSKPKNNDEPSPKKLAK